MAAIGDEAAERLLVWMEDRLVGAFGDVWDEMKRAISKHGMAEAPCNPRKSNADRLPILGEEFGEVCRAMTYDEGGREVLRKELAQVAGVAVLWLVGLELEDIREGRNEQATVRTGGAGSGAAGGGATGEPEEAATEEAGGGAPGGSDGEAEGSAAAHGGAGRPVPER